MPDDLPAELRRIAETGDPLPEWRRDQLGRAVFSLGAQSAHASGVPSGRDA
jgi:hypothetical protein